MKEKIIKFNIVNDMIMRKELRLTHRQAIVNLVTNAFRKNIILYGKTTTKILAYTTATAELTALKSQLELKPCEPKNKKYILACIEYYEIATPKQQTRIVNEAMKKAVGC